jgi:hypothetical protein
MQAETQERLRKYEKEDEERGMEQLEEFGCMSPGRVRFFTYQLHVIYSFHLRDYRWKMLFVRHVRRVPGPE